MINATRSSNCQLTYRPLLIAFFVFLSSASCAFAQEVTSTSSLEEAFPKMLPTDMKQTTNISEPDDGTGYLYEDEQHLLALKVYALSKEELEQAKQQMDEGVKSGEMQKGSYENYVAFEKADVIKQSPTEGKLEGHKVYVFTDNFVLQAVGDGGLELIYEGVAGLQLDEISAIVEEMQEGKSAKEYFDIALSEAGKKAVTDPDRMNAELLLDILEKEGQITYSGEEPAMAKQIVFFSGPSGTGKTMNNEAFKILPGTHDAGKFMEEERVASLLEKAVSGNDFLVKEVSFSDSVFDPNEQFPDSLFGEMNLKDDQVGIILVFSGEEGLSEEISSRPMGLILSPASK